MSKSRIKTMIIVFFDIRGIVHCEFVPQGQTVNSAFYLEVLRRLKRQIARVRTDIKDTVKLHHDNATSHTDFIITNFLARSNTPVIPHPPYSPDLAPIDTLTYARWDLWPLDMPRTWELLLGSVLPGWFTNLCTVEYVATGHASDLEAVVGFCAARMGSVATGYASDLEAVVGFCGRFTTGRFTTDEPGHPEGMVIGHASDLEAVVGCCAAWIQPHQRVQKESLAVRRVRRQDLAYAPAKVTEMKRTAAESPDDPGKYERTNKQENNTDTIQTCKESLAVRRVRRQDLAYAPAKVTEMKRTAAESPDDPGKYERTNKQENNTDTIQTCHRMNIANEMLDSVRDDPNLLQRVITGDEAWVYGYDVETKAQSSQWKLPHEPRPKKARQVRSNVKVLMTVFFDCRGLVHHEFLPQGRTVKKGYYLQVMRNLREAIRQKRPDLWKNKNWLLHHDNAPAHTPLLVRDFLAKNNTLMMPQPPYSPDLAPCDFFLFPKLKRPMKGRRYATLDEIKTASKEELKKIFKK
ncbi:hypothetical protein LAZ67_15001859 [Cordylochernes scorpioides]|uniref:Transposase n=1 Tax=Cordylochernes scorpioides TaxID=51811 RepID=A0ABY6LDW6_9ARAC|nr:hypothetical protein LAZ67_15001859 [Cordylochernes scorpioides]